MVWANRRMKIKPSNVLSLTKMGKSTIHLTSHQIVFATGIVSSDLNNAANLIEIQLSELFLKVLTFLRFSLHSQMTESLKHLGKLIITL